MILKAVKIRFCWWVASGTLTNTLVGAFSELFSHFGTKHRQIFFISALVIYLAI